MKIKLIVKEKIHSDRTFKYRMLVFAFGYRNCLIELDDYKIAEILNCTIIKLKELDVGEYDVGSIYGLE